MSFTSLAGLATIVHMCVRCAPWLSMGFADVSPVGVMCGHVPPVNLVPRIQRQRISGWRMPDGAVYVGRPSFWGNRFVVKVHESCGFVVSDTKGTVYSPEVGSVWSKAQAFSFAVELFRSSLTEVFIGEVQRKLVGKQLACWCPLDVPCHGDVLSWVAAGGSVRHWSSSLGLFNMPLCDASLI